MKKLRIETKKVKKDFILYSEGYGPIFSKYADCTYDTGGYILGWLFEKLESRKMTAKILREWLKNKHLVTPTGSVKIYAIQTHDIPRNISIAKEELLQCLFAVFAFGNAGVMYFVERIIKNDWPILKTFLTLRNNEDILKYGNCNYNIETDNENVFAIERKYKNNVIIPVVNFSDKEEKARIFSKQKKFTDIFGSLKITSNKEYIEIKLKPYQIALLKSDYK